MEPKNPIPDFILALAKRMRYMLMLATIPDNVDITTTSAKLKTESDGTYHTKTGEKKTNCDAAESATNNVANIALDR
jgi:hypothetical protein